MITSIGELFARVRSLFRKTDLDRDFNSELDGYPDMAIEENKQRGMSEAEARRQALLRLGGKEQAREQHRDARGLPGLEAFWQDARYAFRTVSPRLAHRSNGSLASRLTRNPMYHVTPR